MQKFRVAAIEPLKAPYEAYMTFDEITEFVGHATPIFLYDDKYALVDEDAGAKGSQSLRNREFIIQEKSPIPITILGNFVVIKQNRTNTQFVSLNDEELKEALYIFRSTSSDATIFI